MTHRHLAAKKRAAEIMEFFLLVIWSHPWPLEGSLEEYPSSWAQSGGCISSQDEGSSRGSRCSNRKNRFQVPLDISKLRQGHSIMSSSPTITAFFFYSLGSSLWDQAILKRWTSLGAPSFQAHPERIQAPGFHRSRKYVAWVPGEGSRSREP